MAILEGRQHKETMRHDGTHGQTGRPGDRRTRQREFCAGSVRFVQGQLPTYFWAFSTGYRAWVASELHFVDDAIHVIRIGVQGGHPGPMERVFAAQLERHLNFTHVLCCSKRRC